jgi:hypothetical protein
MGIKPDKSLADERQRASGAARAPAAANSLPFGALAAQRRVLRERTT